MLRRCGDRRPTTDDRRPTVDGGRWTVDGGRPFDRLRANGREEWSWVNGREDDLRASGRGEGDGNFI
jgi:hypothetical protein